MSPYLAEVKVNAEQFFQAGLHDLPLESVDFSGSKQKSEGLAAFQQEAWTGAKWAREDLFMYKWWIIDYSIFYEYVEHILIYIHRKSQKEIYRKHIPTYEELSKNYIVVCNVHVVYVESLLYRKFICFWLFNATSNLFWLDMLKDTFRSIVGVCLLWAGVIWRDDESTDQPQMQSHEAKHVYAHLLNKSQIDSLATSQHTNHTREAGTAGT